MESRFKQEYVCIRMNGIKVEQGWENSSEDTIEKEA